MASLPKLPNFAPKQTATPAPAPPTPPPAWQPPTGAVPAPVPAPLPPTVNYPTPAQQTAFNQKGISGNWANWFSSIFGDFNAYYTPARGGEAQATQDYRQWQTAFGDIAGRPATESDMQNVLSQYRQWILANRRLPSLSDLYDFTRQLVGTQKQPSPNVYSRIGNI